MPEVSLTVLAKAIRDLHGCEATWLESVSVREEFEGVLVWQGEVQVFTLEGHLEAKRCYAWSHETGRSGKRRFFAVLHIPPVDSPHAAVRAAIVSESERQQED